METITTGSAPGRSWALPIAEIPDSIDESTKIAEYTKVDDFHNWPRGSYFTGV